MKGVALWGLFDILKKEHKEFNLGYFNFEDANRQKIKAVVIRYMPDKKKKIA